MPTLNNIFPVPSGGVIGINLTTATSGSVTLSRAVSGSGGLGSFTVLYSGAPLSDTGETMFFLDIGDQTPGPLQPGTQYVYQLTDGNGTIQGGPVITASSVDILKVDFKAITIALVQGAVQTLNLPDGINRARVLNAMPLAGNPPLPMIFLNQDLVQQQYVPIGIDDEHVGDLLPGLRNVYTITELDRHMVRLTVMSLNSIERDFYRDFVRAVVRVGAAYAFSQFGGDVSVSSEAADYQEVDQTNLMIPGFYASDVLFDFLATQNFKITTSYNLIETILIHGQAFQDNQFTQILPGQPDNIVSATVSGSGVPVEVEVPTL